jgi:hypothetical protein
MVKHKPEEIDSVILNLKPTIREITQVNDPMSHDKWNVVCVLNNSDRAVFIWDTKSLNDSVSQLRHDIFGKLSKMRGNFYV